MRRQAPRLDSLKDLGMVPKVPPPQKGTLSPAGQRLLERLADLKDGEALHLLSGEIEVSAGHFKAIRTRGYSVTVRQEDDGWHIYFSRCKHLHMRLPAAGAADQTTKVCKDCGQRLPHQEPNGEGRPWKQRGK